MSVEPSHSKTASGQPTTAEVKGATCLSAFAQLREDLGEAEFARLVSGAPEPSQPLFARKLLAVEWIPQRQWFTFVDYLHEDYFKGDTARLKEFFGRVCERDFNSLYKVFIRLGSPWFIIDRASQAFRKYHNRGSLSVVERRDLQDRHQIVIALRDFEPWPVEEHTLSAYIEKLLKMSGARDVQVNTVRSTLLPHRLDIDYEASFAK